jgi:AGZA family xanthine/uracil permease-like MFS transporter
MIGILCFLGLFGVLDALLPVPAIVPILLYIGLLIGAQAFQAVPRLHAVAVVAALLPNLAQWASRLIDNALNAAGTSAAKVGLDARNGAGVVYDGLQTLGEGAVLVGLILGTMVTFILEKKFLYAAIASFAGAVLSFIGLIHAPEVAWAANPPSKSRSAICSSESSASHTHSCRAPKIRWRWTRPISSRVTD